MQEEAEKDWYDPKIQAALQELKARLKAA